MRCRLLLLLSLLATLPAVVAAAEGPLPPGALRRLGMMPPRARAADAGAREDEEDRDREEHLRVVYAVCLSEDGRTVTTRRGDGTVQVWELATGKLLHQWRIDRELTWALSPDGKVVAVVGKDDALVLRAADTGKQVRRFGGPPTSAVGYLTFSADSRTLIARHSDPSQISRWDVATGRLLDRARYEMDRGELTAASADGRMIALGSLEGALQIWDQGARQVRCRRNGYEEVLGLAFSRDGSRLASLCDGKTIWLWDTKTYQPLRRLSWRGLGASTVSFSPDGTLLASNAGPEVVLWETATGKVRRTFLGHQGVVFSATFTPDGKQLLTGSLDGTVLVWDLTAPPPPVPQPASVRKDRHGDPLPAAVRARLGCRRLYVDSFFVDYKETHLAFSADGKQLFVGVPQPEGESGPVLDVYPAHCSPGVRVLDVPTGKESPRLEDVPEGIDCLTGSPDGKTLAALIGPTLYLWDASTGHLKRMAHNDLHGPDPFQPRCLTYSPDGRLLAAANEGQIELLDAETGQRIRALRGVVRGVAALAFSGDGKQLISCSGPSKRKNEKDEIVLDPGAVACWDVGTGKGVGRLTLPADSDLRAFCLSADGALLAARHGHRGVRLWDIPSGRELPSIPGAGDALAFSPDGKHLAIGGGKLRLWDLAARREVLSVPSVEPCIWLIRFAPDGKRLVTREGTRLHFWDLDKRQEIVTHEGHRGPINALACADRGRLLLSGGADRTLRLWDTTTSQLLRELPGHDRPVTTLALSPDGKRAASLDAAGRVFLWDAATGRQLRQAKLAAVSSGGWLPTQAITFSEDGKVLLVVDGTGSVRLWQVGPWKELPSFPADMLPQGRPAFSADGKLLALPGGAPGRGAWLRLLETGTGAERWRITHKDSNGQFRAMAFSPNGGYLAVSRAVDSLHESNAERGKQVVLHEATTGKEVLVFAAGISASALAFSPDGKTLATADQYEKPPRLWDVRTGKLLGELGGPRNAATTLAFSPDGHTLFSAGEDGTILVWDVARLPLRQPERPRDLMSRRLQQAWDDLAGADAARAFRAIGDLSAVPAKTLPLLQARLRPAVAEDPHRIAGLITDLGSEDFNAREEATRRLIERVDQAEPALRQALRDQPTLETRRRLERILGQLHTSGEQQRAWRVCLLLDWLDTPEAEQLLHTLAGGAVDSRLTREARAALKRRK